MFCSPAIRLRHVQLDTKLIEHKAELHKTLENLIYCKRSIIVFIIFNLLFFRNIIISKMDITCCAALLHNATMETI